MKVVIVGTGDAFSATHYGSSAAIVGSKGLVLLDAPDSIIGALADASASSGLGISAFSITDILLTHLHGDHVNGLEAIGFMRWLEQRRSNAPLPKLHTFAEVAERLWERLAPAMDQGGQATLADYFELCVLPEHAAATVAGLSVRFRRGRHTVPCCGFLIGDGRVTFGWSGDTGWDPAHVEWLSAADMFVHETSPAPAHTPVEHLNALPAPIRAKMRLIHMPDTFDPTSTTIPLLRDGQVLEI